MAAEVVFVPNVRVWEREFRSWDGMVGFHILKKTRQAQIAIIAETPAPGKPPRNRTGINYATGELAIGGIRVSRSRWKTELEGQVVAIPEHAVMLHQGTIPHVIVPRRAKFLRFNHRGTGKVVVTRRVNHPGTAANDFMVRGLKKAVPG